MSPRRRSILAVPGVLSIFLLAACSGGGAATTAPAASVPAASAPASDAASPGGAGGAACTATADAGTVTASMAGTAFVPPAITAKVGDVIAWTNRDSVPHTATLDDDLCTTESLSEGGVGALAFSAPGTYPFHCNVHPTMTGTIEVTS